VLGMLGNCTLQSLGIRAIQTAVLEAYEIPMSSTSTTVMITA
jgi:hypothetical protein